MDVTGTIATGSGESRINDVLIKKRGSGDPIRAATDFLASKSIRSGDCATLSGEFGTDAQTFFMVAALKVPQTECQAADSFAFAPAGSAKKKKAPPKVKRTARKKPSKARGAVGKKATSAKRKGRK